MYYYSSIRIEEKAILFLLKYEKALNMMEVAQKQIATRLLVISC